MQLISSKIIPAAQDALWELRPDILTLIRRPVLVLTTPYQSGGSEDKLLENLLQNACKIASDNINIIQLAAGEFVSWPLLREQLQPEYVLMMGIHPQQTGIQAVLYFNQINNFNDAVIIPTLAPANLIQPSEMKKALWNGALQPLFSTPLQAGKA